jgi:hypothetical protein
MKLVQMKPVQELFWANEWRPLKIYPMDIESGIPLTHHLMDPIHKEVPGLLL